MNDGKEGVPVVPDVDRIIPAVMCDVFVNTGVSRGAGGCDILFVLFFFVICLYIL